MGTGEEWILRPVQRGMITYIDLVDGRLHLEDVLRCNAYLDCIDENEARLNEVVNKNE